MKLSSGIGPRLSYIVRLAFALSAVVFLFPVILALGAYGFIPRLEVTSFSWTDEFVIFAAGGALLAIVLLYPAISGRNPFHKIDLRMAREREELNAARKNEDAI